MKKFMDMDSKCLKELGLSYLPGLNKVRAIVYMGYVEVYELKKLNWRGKEEYSTDYVPWVASSAPFCVSKIMTEVRSSTGVMETTLVERIEVPDFESIPERVFVDILGIPGRNLCRFLWLQRYLKGEVSAPYKEEEDAMYAAELSERRIQRGNEKIRTLESKISGLKEAVYKLQKENEELKRTLKNTEKARDKIIDFMCEMKKLADKIEGVERPKKMTRSEMQEAEKARLAELFFEALETKFGGKGRSE